MIEAEQVLKLYETGLTDVPTLAKAMNMDDLAVHRILYEGNSAYRAKIHGEATGGGDRAVEMLEIMTDVARTSTVPGIKLRAAQAVRDDILGRRDAAPVDKGLNTDLIAALADRIAKLRDKRRNLIANGPAIEV